MGKRLANAPLIYTLTQVRHNPILKISDPVFVSGIQDRLRKMGYSDYQTLAAVNISLPDPSLGVNGQHAQPVISQFERHTFANKEATKCFVVDRNAVTFQTNDYGVFETFSNDFAAGLSVINECVGGFDFISRIGIRYLDVVHPSKGEAELPRYLQSGMLGISSALSDDFRVNYSLSECHATYKDVGNVLTRTIISGGPLAFPEDLQLIGVKIQDKFKGIHGVHAVIDTDASFEQRISFELNDIIKRLDNLHIAASTAFKSSVTSYAIESWA